MEDLPIKLGINWPVVITQVVTFVILVVLLRVVAYKPVMRMLDERSRRIQESMEQTEFIKKQAAQSEQEYKKRIDAAGKDGQELVARAVKAGEEARRQAQEVAKQDAEVLITRARSEIQQERDESVDELRREFADLAVLAAEKVVERSLDKKAHRELIDKVLEEGTTLQKD